MFVRIPLHIDKNTENPGRFETESDIHDSIRSFLNLLVGSYQGTFDADPEFGFVFKNYRFENFNEEKGVLYSSNADEDVSIYHKHKVHGKSTNLNTFAYDLKKSIEQYEKRLRNVSVDMKYKSVDKIVAVIITGKVVNTGNDNDKFEHVIKIHVW